MSSDNSAPFEFSYRTRQRIIDACKSNPDQIIDVLVVGGGIVGAGLLRVLALHKVPDILLIEKGDFASGTSGASSKLIHAGLRYLESAWEKLKQGHIKDAVNNFLFVWAASYERKILGRMLPGLIKPKKIFFVLGRGSARAVLSVFSGVTLYWLMQVLQGQFFSFPNIYLRKKTIKRDVPDVNPEQVKAVFTFWDSETDDARLVMENLQDAVRRGARAMNYVELVRYDVREEYVDAVLADRETNTIFKLKTKILINATGAYVDATRRLNAALVQSDVRWVDRVAGAHIDVVPPLANGSFYVTAADGRLIFLLRRDEDGFVYTRVGTTERPLMPNEPSDYPHITPTEIDYLMKTVLEFFPGASFGEPAFVHTDAGIRPLRRQNDPSTFHKSREHDIVNEGRVLHVIGVKLTDYRRVSTEIGGKINWPIYGISFDKSVSDKTPLRANGDYYTEKTAQDFLDRTMVIHWEDYLKRRRGLKPQWMEQKLTDELKKDFEVIKKDSHARGK